jgi:hypothetical protein
MKMMMHRPSSSLSLKFCMQLQILTKMQTDRQTVSQSQQPPKQKCPLDWPPLESIPLGCLLLAVFALLFENRVLICEEEAGVMIAKIFYEALDTTTKLLMI